MATDVNYIKEINAFYDWIETNIVSDSAISLWHALMHINNKTGWKDEFSVAMSVLESKTGLKKDALIRARKALQKANRISTKSRTGMQSAVYKITPFDTYGNGGSENCVVLNDTKCDTKCDTNRAQTATLTATLTASIPKQNKTKQNNIYTPEFESFWQNYPRQEAKQTALKQWNIRIAQHESPEDMVTGAKGYAASCKSKGTESTYIKLPATFIGPDKHYLDFLETKSSNSIMAELGFEDCDIT